jgi:2'-5' RNA ligase
MSPNWFVALPLHGNGPLTFDAPPEGIRRFETEDLHLTIAFLGPCGEAAAWNGWDVVRRFLGESHQPPIPYALGDVVPMGSPSRYSALSALLRDGHPECVHLINALRNAICAASGAAGDARPPLPHVTLARPSRRASDEERRAGLLWSRRLRLHGGQGTFDRIALYTWPENRNQRLFRIVADLPFASS